MKVAHAFRCIASSYDKDRGGVYAVRVAVCGTVIDDDDGDSPCPRCKAILDRQEMSIN